MGDGPQEIGPQLFAFRQHRRLLFLPGILFILQRQRTFAQNRKKDPVGGRVKRHASHPDTGHAVNPLPNPKRQVKILGVRKLLRRRSGRMIIFKYPGNQPAVLFLIVPHSAVFRRVKKARRRQLPSGAVEHHHVAAGQLPDLHRRRGKDFLPVFRLRQNLVGIKKDLRPVGDPGRLEGLLLIPKRQGAGDKRGQEHDHKGNRIAGSVSRQREPGRRKQIIENKHARRRGNQAVAPMGSNDRRQHRSQNIHHDNIGVCETDPLQKQAEHRHRRQDQTAFQNIFRHIRLPAFL